MDGIMFGIRFPVLQEILSLLKSTETSKPESKPFMTIQGTHILAVLEDCMALVPTGIYIPDPLVLMGIRRVTALPPSLMVEATGPEHGMERYKIKIIKKYNIKPEKIMPKYRTRPYHELSGVVIGKNITYETARDYVLRYLNESAQQNTVMTIRLQR